MSRANQRRVKGCATVAVVVLGLPVLIVAIVAAYTWTPLRHARNSLDELEQVLGAAASYTPDVSGRIPAERVELFLELRHKLLAACDDYGTVQRGFESVDSLDSMDSADPRDVVEVMRSLGGASLAITPFLARFFELRNDALLDASMGLQEYVYIYAVAYHDQLLDDRTRAEIFSDGEALSPQASKLLLECTGRQLEALETAGIEASVRQALETEVEKMAADSSRLIWQDGLPAAVLAGVMPYRERLDRAFCAATAGLEMEQGARRALRIALE